MIENLKSLNTNTYNQLFPIPTDKGFVLIGDTQKTMFYQILMGRESNNHNEREILIDSISKMRPDFVMILGDLVSYGQSHGDWNYFDEIMAPLRAQNLPIFPVMGNHDYFFSIKRSLPKLLQRFSILNKKTWYSFTYGNLGIISIDSNKNILGKTNWDKQLQWINQEINHFEINPDIKGIMMMGHHPPYTNSFEVFPHGPTKKDILPLFFQSKKTMLYFSGHCHAYERFEVSGKTFIVSGGGGGPRQPLRLGRWQRFKDQFQGSRMRPFHYIWCGPTESGVTLTIIGGEKGMTSPSIVEKVPYTFSTLESL